MWARQFSLYFYPQPGRAKGEGRRKEEGSHLSVHPCVHLCFTFVHCLIRPLFIVFTFFLPFSLPLFTSDSPLFTLLSSPFIFLQSFPKGITYSAQNRSVPDLWARTDAGGKAEVKEKEAGRPTEGRRKVEEKVEKGAKRRLDGKAAGQGKVGSGRGGLGRRGVGSGGEERRGHRFHDPNEFTPTLAAYLIGSALPY